MECEDQDTQQRDPKTHEMYLNVMRRFSQALLKVLQLFFFPLFFTNMERKNEVASIGKCCIAKQSSDLAAIPVQGDKSVRVMRSLLAAQQTFVDRLVQLMKAVQRESGNRKKKVRTRLPCRKSFNQPQDLTVTRFCPVCLCRQRGCRPSWRTMTRCTSQTLSPSPFLWSLRSGSGASSPRPPLSLRYRRTSKILHHVYKTSLVPASPQFDFCTSALIVCCP